jgi:hypothetical protein
MTPAVAARKALKRVEAAQSHRSRQANQEGEQANNQVQHESSCIHEIFPLKR